MYHKQLGIDRERMHYLPYGDRRPPAAIADSPVDDEVPKQAYYLAEGYSNRDYVSLIAAFRTIPAPLAIVCSALNTEIDGLDLPANVQILRDLPSERFEAYVRRTRACIFPLQHDTGASGQSVMLRVMRNGKIIIASDFGSVRGYVADATSAYLIKDIRRDLGEVVAQIECDPAAARRGDAAYRRYCEDFSPPATAATLGWISSVRLG